MEPKRYYNALLGQKVIRELTSRNITGFYIETKEEAKNKVLEILPVNSVVSWGGSLTLSEIGLIESLKKGAYNLLDPGAGTSGTEKDKIAHQALSSDYYLMSANAISASGELVNIDGIGNRVAALIYGPKHVIVVAGINKVEQSLDLAILRAKNKVAPLVLLRYGKNNNISSFEELASKSQSIGSQLVITNMSTFKDRITVILVGECLGF